MPQQPGDTTGFPNPSRDHMEKGLDLHKFAVRHPDATYFWLVEGDGMRDASISDGDVMIIDCAIDARSGDVVVVKLHGQFLARRYMQVAGHVTLQSDLPDHPPIILREEETCDIWGVVIFVLHRPNPGRRRP
jgi:DNA polymerase V